MRASRIGASLGLAVLLASPVACSKNKPGTNVSVADGEGNAGGSESARTKDGAAGPAQPRADLEKIEFSGQITGVGDMLDGGSQLINMWSPPPAGAPPTNLRDFIKLALIQEGFGPGFLESIDLDGAHAMDFAYPHEGQAGVTPADIELAVTVASTDAVRAIESLPAAMQPQPLGQDLWQVVEDDVQLFFRAQPDAMEMAMTMEDLDRATSLRGQVKPGPRIQMRASNLPAGEIDVSELIPLPPAAARPLSSILNETESVELFADFGTDRALTARAEAQAPFSRLGLDPIGPATQDPSELAKAMPANALAVWVMPWGDPAMLHQILDKRIPVDQIPAPFDGYVDQVVGGAHGILDAIEGEVLAAPYLDDKGRFTLVLAAEVKDEDAARKSLRATWTAAEKAFKDHIALAGSSPEHKYSVKFKKDGVRAGKHKGDLFTLTAPKDMHDELESLAWFVGAKKPKLEVASVVADGKVVVAIGAGQKDFMRSLGRRLGKKAGDDGLESGGGLALARELSEGCQYCVALDPVEIADFLFTTIADSPDEPDEVKKAAKEARAKLAKLKLDGEVALAARLGADRGAFGFGIPKQLLFAKPDEVKAIVEMIESIDEARDAAWQKAATAAEAPAAKKR